MKRNIVEELRLKAGDNVLIKDFMSGGTYTAEVDAIIDDNAVRAIRTSHSGWIEAFNFDGSQRRTNCPNYIISKVAA